MIAYNIAEESMESSNAFDYDGEPIDSTGEEFSEGLSMH